LTTAAVLNAGGVTNIHSAAEAAEALRLAGDLTFVLFALGIVGTGLLAVPVLAGSAAYCVSEAFGWPATLAAIMHHASLFCAPGSRTHAVDPSVWIGVRQLAVQRVWG
jgi:Mn2+/Fe2+ NRAMP family transporter